MRHQTPARPRAGPKAPTRAAQLRRRRERGSEALQFAGITLPLLLLLFGILQAALYFVTDLQTASAAQTGVQAARGETSPAGAGAAAARASIARIGIARDVDVTETRTATDVTVTVTATAPTLVPFLPLPTASATAHGIVEQVTR